MIFTFGIRLSVGRPYKIPGYISLRSQAMGLIAHSVKRI